MRTKTCPSCQNPIQTDNFHNHMRGCKGPRRSSKPAMIEANPKVDDRAVKAQLGEAARLRGQLKFVPKPHRAAVKAKFGLA